MTSANELLNAAYRDLGFQDGALFDAMDRPLSGEISHEDWINKGEWLALAKAVGIEKVFFVEDNPVVVFAKCEQPDSESVRQTINRIWCMARPQCLFLAQPGELFVLDLTCPPVSDGEDIDSEGRLLRRVSLIADVQKKLADFRRELLESGLQPEGQGYYSPGKARADKALIENLKTVRAALLGADLNNENGQDKAKYANALIGRSIFIRYLEDRGILQSEDFREVAKRRRRWGEILDSPQGVPVDPSMEDINYTKVLADREFTYALFDRVYHDFNGDLFPVSDGERAAVDQTHLNLLRRFLCGEIADDIPRLFFFAYQFNVVPIELISSIYEAFYNAEQGAADNQGAHYTPIELVEYLLSRVLTPEQLEQNPRILDPACGSGVFLVESFRRIVRYRQFRSGRRLGLPELRKILREQIHGIDINGEAVRVAAFSLYLALLHYLDPPDIWRDKKLPSLAYDSSRKKRGANQYDVLLTGNSFAIANVAKHDDVSGKFSSESFDVVVGNPPWGYPKPTDEMGIREAKVALKWCEESGCVVGDKELSQAFVHRTLDFLREGGMAGMLVSTGVFFKHHPNSQTFRRQWLSQSRIDHVVNFAAVRNLFFGHAVAPFASVVFGKSQDVPDSHLIQYWSAKNTLQAKKMNAVVLSRADHRWLNQREALIDDSLWKIYWWGNHHDRELVAAFELEQSLVELLVPAKGDENEVFGRGLEGKGADAPPDWLRTLRQLPTKQFVRYGPLKDDVLGEPPAAVRRRGHEFIFRGPRLLVRRGISQSGGRNGEIVARWETEPFCFRNSIHGVNLDSLPEWKSKILLGILWSSLSRYYFWLTVGAWGMWHHELHETDIKRLPVRFPKAKSLRQKIVKLVDRLRTTSVIADDVFPPADDVPVMRESEARGLERQLDELIFDLFELSEFDRNLVRDMCDVGLDLFYRHSRSNAVKGLRVPDAFTSGLLEDVPQASQDNDLATYLGVLLRIWNQELGSDGKFAWSVVCPDHFCPMVAVILETVGVDSPRSHMTDDNRRKWSNVLRRLNEASLHHDGSSRVFIDGMVRLVSDHEILIVKRNERRLWTASMAREDAEATILQAMQLQERN